MSTWISAVASLRCVDLLTAINMGGGACNVVKLDGTNEQTGTSGLFLHCPPVRECVYKYVCVCVSSLRHLSGTATASTTDLLLRRRRPGNAHTNVNVVCRPLSFHLSFLLPLPCCLLPLFYYSLDFSSLSSPSSFQPFMFPPLPAPVSPVFPPSFFLTLSLSDSL